MAHRATNLDFTSNPPNSLGESLSRFARKVALYLLAYPLLILLTSLLGVVAYQVIALDKPFIDFVFEAYPALQKMLAP